MTLSSMLAGRKTSAAPRVILHRSRCLRMQLLPPDENDELVLWDDQFASNRELHKQTGNTFVFCLVKSGMVLIIVSLESDRN